MKGVPARKVRLLIDQFDFSGDTSGVTLTLAGDVIDAPALQMDALQRIAGEAGIKIEHNGYYTGPDAGDLEHELSDRMGTDTAVTLAVLLDTRAVGNPAYVLEQAWGEQLTLDVPIKELLTLAGAWGEGPALRGYVLLDGAIAATGVGTVVTLPAGGTAGGKAFLFVRSITGTAVGADVTIQMDTAADMASPTVAATLTFSALGVVAVDLVGTVERYVRVNVTDLGGATGFTATLIVCVNGVTM